MARVFAAPPSVTPSPDRPIPGPAGSAMTTGAVLIVALVVLYLGSALFIPFALAILLSFALGPLVLRLRRWGVGRMPAVLLVVALACVGLGGFALLLGSQVVQLADNLPTYQTNIQAKIRSLQTAAPRGGVLERAGTMFRELSREVSGDTAEEGSAAGTLPSDARPPRPVPVRIEPAPASPLAIIGTLAGPLLGPLGTAGLVIVFVFLILLEHEDLRDRLLRLVGGSHLSVTTEALNDAAQRVSRYLLMQLIVNATYGLPIGLGLFVLGVPNALLWGVLATLLRFIPYVGPFLAALFPLALALAVAPGWSLVFWTLGLFLALELVSNNIVEPWLYGASTGISALAIVLAALFWTTLWGPVGLFLSTPLTVCLVVMGRYIPQLQFLDVLLGNAPVLTAAERLYQRMLAGDPEEGAEIAQELLQERPLAAVYEEVVLPALRLAERDRQRQILLGEQRAVVTESFLQVVAELGDSEEPERAATAPAALASVASGWAGTPVLCIAGRTGLDRVATAMLAQLLARGGIEARGLPPEALSPAGLAGLDSQDVALVCLVYLSPAGSARAPQACRRLRRQMPGAQLLVGLWQGSNADTPVQVHAGDLASALITTSLAQTLEQIGHLAGSPAEPALAPTPLPGREPERRDEEVSDPGSPH